MVPLDNLGTTNGNMWPFIALFPKDTTRIRFYATTNNPVGDRNKGRIVLDNFKVEYNLPSE